MKKTTIALLMFLLTFLLVSCQNEQNVQIKEINTDFTVSSNIRNNYLYQQSSKLLISGKCEVGAKIIATLYSDIDVEVEEESIIVDHTGNYEIILNTPKGSYDNYYLIIKDYHSKFVKKYTNILFGEVHLLLGDHLINDVAISNQNNIDSEEKIYFLDYTNPKNEWNVIEDLSSINDFRFNLYNILKSSSNYNKCPIGFVNVTYQNTLIEEWLPLEYATKSPSVISFLSESGKYYENPYQKGQMSYVANNLLSSLYNYSFGTITLSFGVNEFKDLYGKVNSENFYNAYSKMLLYVVRNIEDSFKNFKEFVLIQTNNVDVKNVNVLRNIQAQISNYCTKVSLIPTFDLQEDEDNTFNYLLANRFYDIVYGKKVISEYANHFIDENEHLVTIEFSNTSLFDFNFDNLKLYDKNGQLLDLEEDKIRGRFNQIIIDLSYEIIDENEEENEVEVGFYQISRIEYAQDVVLSGEFIYNNNDLPVVPFIISFE